MSNPGRRPPAPVRPTRPPAGNPFGNPRAARPPPPINTSRPQQSLASSVASGAPAVRPPSTPQSAAEEPTPAYLSPSRLNSAAGLQFALASQRTELIRRIDASKTELLKAIGETKKSLESEIQGVKGELSLLQQNIPATYVTTVRLNKVLTRVSSATGTVLDQLEGEVNDLGRWADDKDGAAVESRSAKELYGEAAWAAAKAVVRKTVWFLYGCPPANEPLPDYPVGDELDNWPTLEAADGEVADYALRFNFSEWINSPINQSAVDQVLRYITQHTGNWRVDAHHSVLAEPLPPAVFQEAIISHLGNLKRSWRTRQPKQDVEEEVMPSDPSNLFLAALSPSTTRGESSSPSKPSARPSAPQLRSRKVVRAGHVIKRRPHSDFAGSQWQVLEEVHAQMGEIELEDDGGKKSRSWLEEEWMSDKCKDALKAILATPIPTTSTSASIKSACQPIFLPQSSTRNPMPPKADVFPHQRLQRWMMSTEWLIENEFTWSDQIVPVDTPTSFDAVSELSWSKEHSYRSTAKGRKQAGRSEVPEIPRIDGLDEGLGGGGMARIRRSSPSKRSSASPRKRRTDGDGATPISKRLKLAFRLESDPDVGGSTLINAAQGSIEEEEEDEDDELYN